MTHIQKLFLLLDLKQREGGMQAVCDIEITGTLCIHLNIEHPTRFK